MTRILLLIVLFWILYLLFKRFVAGSNQASKTSQPKPAEKIVQCSQCGLRIPESESQIKSDLIYCNNPQCNNAESQKKPHGD